MPEVIRIPMFPLSILPLPGELVPLHIFEPRYRQLLHDMETTDMTFGIYFSNETNTAKIGAVMRLESVLKRYPAGESDIIVKCEDIFSLDALYKTFKDKLYPGGDVTFWNVDTTYFPKPSVYKLFLEYLKLRNITHHISSYTIYQIANELNLSILDRYRILTLDEVAREQYVLSRIKFQIHLLHQEDKSKDVYHLN